MDRCDSSEDEYEEIDEEILDVLCLFCPVHSTSFEDIFAHTKENHQLDFVDTCKSAGLDTFQFIKLVNYIRKNTVDPTKVKEVITSKLFDTDAYLKPVLEDDHLLMFDYDDGGEDEMNGYTDGNIASEVKQLNDGDLESHYKSLPKEKVIEDLLSLKAKYDMLHNSINEMSEFIKGSITDDADTVSKKEQPLNAVANLDDKSDSSYISSYSHFGIHHEMLSDKPRTLAYQDAILENTNMFKGKTVLDIGAGTGILALFAAKAGANIVVAVDQSDIIYNAMDIIRLNGFESVIKPVKGKLESIQFDALNLPTKYDFIISEWMGYFLLFEGMLDTVIYARDHLLKQEGGTLLPNRSKIFFAAFSDSKFFERNIDFWNDVYGFNMSSMIKDVTSEATVDLIGEDNICSSTETICELDIAQCSLDSALTVNSEFELNFEKDATIHGFVGWFDCYFDSLSKAVVLSTSPFAEPTHWKQTIFQLKEPLTIEAGKSITGQMEITRSSNNARALKVKIVLKNFNLSLEYIIGC